jgi:hypothetical protein
MLVAVTQVLLFATQAPNQSTDIWNSIGLVVVGAILAAVFTAKYDDWFRQPGREERMFKALLDELRDNRKRSEENRRAAIQETNVLTRTEIKAVPLLPLSELGWEALRSTGIIANQEESMITRLRKAYADTGTHNQLISMRNSIVSSGLPDLDRVSLLRYYDTLLHQTISDLIPQIDQLELDIEKKAGEVT